jgi:hypothetical protein
VNFGLFALSAALIALPSLLQADDRIELATLMGELQRYSHKIHLSLEAGNRPLAGFYAHEMEEIIETLVEIDEYDGHPVGQLTRDRLAPAFKAFENSLGGMETVTPSLAFDQMLDACNNCHEAAARGTIVIRKNPQNTYMQSFKPVP